MLLRYCVSLGLACILMNGLAHAQPNKPPKLVVGIVVDQMRADYIQRYWNDYGDDGFKRLLQGYQCTAMHYNYVPTYTAPGHASIYTGAPPAVHGIVANEWYHRGLHKTLYCTDDSTVQGVGGTGRWSKMSPRNMLASTLTDQLRLASQQASKCVGIALKDRGAILPAGHSGEAYWFDRGQGHWITSSYYHTSLPHWVQQFNARQLPDSLMLQGWSLLRPAATYNESTADDMPYESPLWGNTKPVFPHKLNKKDSPNATYNELLYSPYGNDLTTAFALAALQAQGLGTRTATDFLAISYSSTDYVGHCFGPSSIEVQDTYLRLDRNLAQLLAALDKQVGRGNYLVFLTADHGAAEAPEYLHAQHLPGGRFPRDQFKVSLSAYLNSLYGAADWLLWYDNQQVYLNTDLMRTKGIDYRLAQDAVADWCRQQAHVAAAYATHRLAQSPLQPGNMFAAGYYPERTGDVMVAYETGWIDDYKADHYAATHGTHYAYDTHVPFLLYGWRVPQGRLHRGVVITDIAPTVAALLGIPAPHGAVSKPIAEIVQAALGQ